MGNTGNPPHPLPQIWQRINHKYLRHRYTQEIIEEHTLPLASQDEQSSILARLKQRIALHHVSIAKVIYFQPAQEDSLCSPHTHHLHIYTEYTGDTLERVAEEKGQRLYHLPCQCQHILSASDYLKDHYGFFRLTPGMVFLGNRKEKNTRVWIHSRVELTEREEPASEQEMCESLCKLLRYLRSNRICSSTTNEHLVAMQKVGTVGKLKELVFGIHRQHEEENRHKKSNSLIVCQPRQEQSQNEGEDHKKAYPAKANSMPQRNEERAMPKGSEGKAKEQLKFISTEMPFRPPNPPNSLKINFSYHRQESSRLKSQSQSQQPPKNAPVEPQHLQLEESSRSVSINDSIQGKPSLFSPFLPISDSLNNSPHAAKLNEPVGSFTAREMELPLHEVGEKMNPARLPTTSRSPKLPKEPGEGKQGAHHAGSIVSSRYKREGGKAPSMNNSGKFQKYKDAIKNYEEKLRQKLANSMGGSNPLAPRGRQHPKKTTSSPPKGGEFKETKSLYNDSEEEAKGKEQLEDSFPQLNEQSQLEVGRREEKEELQRQLQKEKVMIEREMQELFKQNAMRDEYRNIREKIKHKKETFAQLKAEATKILEDLEY